MDRAFVETLEGLAGCLNQTGASWMLIGGAVPCPAWLYLRPVKDSDQPAPCGNMPEPAVRIGKPRQPARRTFPLGRPVATRFRCIPVGLLSGFRVNSDQRRVPVGCDDAVPVMVGAQPVLVPRPARLAAILRLCGRPKDMHRNPSVRALTPTAHMPRHPACSPPRGWPNVKPQVFQEVAMRSVPSALPSVLAVSR